MVNDGFGSSPADPCLDIKADVLFILMPDVDDIFFIGEDAAAVGDTKRVVMDKFPMTNLG